MEVSYNKSSNFVFTAVYGSLHSSIRSELWNGLRDIAENESKPWLVAEDFNTFLDRNEKSGGSMQGSMGCKKFRAWIRDFNIQDMGFIGQRYTWKRGMVQERLDRFVCNEEWKGWFANFRVVHLPRIKFDHCPIMLQIEGQRKVNNQRPPKFG